MDKLYSLIIHKIIKLLGRVIRSEPNDSFQVKLLEEGEIQNVGLPRAIKVFLYHSPVDGGNVVCHQRESTAIFACFLLFFPYAATLNFYIHPP